MLGLGTQSRCLRVEQDCALQAARWDNLLQLIEPDSAELAPLGQPQRDPLVHANAAMPWLAYRPRQLPFPTNSADKPGGGTAHVASLRHPSLERIAHTRTTLHQLAHRPHLCPHYPVLLHQQKGEGAQRGALSGQKQSCVQGLACISSQHVPPAFCTTAVCSLCSIAFSLKHSQASPDERAHSPPLRASQVCSLSRHPCSREDCPTSTHQPAHRPHLRPSQPHSAA